MNLQQIQELRKQILEIAYCYDEESAQDGVVESRIDELLCRYYVVENNKEVMASLKSKTFTFKSLFTGKLNDSELRDNYKQIIDKQLSKFNVSSDYCYDFVHRNDFKRPVLDLVIRGLKGEIIIQFSDTKYGTRLWMRLFINAEKSYRDSENCGTLELFNLAIRNWLPQIQ